MNCVCCGENIGDNNKCGYCGKSVIIGLDDSGVEQAKTAASEYRSQLISQITNISTDVLLYKVEDNKFVSNGKKTISIANGKDCFNKLVWSKESFVQVPGQGKRTLTIRYNFREDTKNISFDIDTPKTDNFWKLGVTLDDHLKLRVYIGDTTSFTCAENLNLSLN